jgi:Tol biopolymer transport system component
VLVFCSDREGGPGSDDIWIATRDSLTSDFGAPTPLPGVNGASSELNVTLSGDGRELVFSSNRDGSRKLFRSTRSCL